MARTITQKRATVYSEFAGLLNTAETMLARPDFPVLESARDHKLSTAA